MSREIGYAGFEEIFPHILDEVVLEEEVNIPSGPNEQAVERRTENIAGKNVVFRHILKGVRAYSHYIPVIISSVASRGELVTAYTPYQAEISQGIPQFIFEHQAAPYELTGMGASSASMYDGATATAEAIVMCKERKKTAAYISVAANPGVIEVMETYRFGSNIEVVMIPERDGVTDAAALEEIPKADPQSTCFYVQQPNCYGNVEDGDVLGRIIHEASAKYIIDCSPMALTVMKTPAGCGADTVMGDGQPLGVPLAFGEPYLGFTTAMATITKRLPGRVVGKTIDSQGHRAFVLTLQAREQHTRREKASSNVYSNQAWCILIVSVYMTATGADGMAKATGQCMSEAHYLRDTLEEAGLESKHDCGFFREFVTVNPEGKCTDSAHISRTLENRGILGGPPLSDREILWCATEMSIGEEMDELASVVREALHRECRQKEVYGS